MVKHMETSLPKQRGNIFVNLKQLFNTVRFAPAPLEDFQNSNFSLHFIFINFFPLYTRLLSGYLESILSLQHRDPSHVLHRHHAEPESPLRTWRQEKTSSPSKMFSGRPRRSCLSKCKHKVLSPHHHHFSMTTPCFLLHSLRTLNPHHHLQRHQVQDARRSPRFASSAMLML
jgi:hypothetical protein